MAVLSYIAGVSRLIFICLLISFTAAQVQVTLSLSPASLPQQLGTTLNVTVNCKATEKQKFERVQRYYNYRYTYVDVPVTTNARILTRLRILMETEASVWQPIAQLTNLEPGRVYVNPSGPTLEAEGSISSNMLTEESEISVKWNAESTDVVKKFRCDAITFAHGYTDSGEYQSSDGEFQASRLNSYSFARLSALEKNDVLTDVNAFSDKMSQEIKVLSDKEKSALAQILGRIKTRLAETKDSFADKILKSKNLTIELLKQVSENQTQMIGKLESKFNSGLGKSFFMMWPKGTYALPKPTTGCPSTAGVLWPSGERRHHTESNGSSKDKVFSGNHLQKPVLYRSGGENFMYQRFCVKTNSKSLAPSWPKGSYCINQYLTCPPDFTEGEIDWDDEDSHSNSTTEGKLPKGDFETSKTKLYYCCRNDSLPNNLVDLPRYQPFYLYRYGGQCQQVTGMNVTEEFIRFDTENSVNEDEFKGDHPDAERNNLILHLCYYDKL